MTTQPQPLMIDVDAANPGQFFACCALLELADRLWPGAEGWFTSDDRAFQIQCGSHTLEELLHSVAHAELEVLNPDDLLSSPIRIAHPFRPLTVDWWENDQTGARDFKVWAGKMESVGIARAMQHAIRDPSLHHSAILNYGSVVMNPDQPGKKREPFYFDARRAPNSHSVDVGFSANDLDLTTLAHPAVELLCLIGLQVARPAFTPQKRIYEYSTWSLPLSPGLLLAAATGAAEVPNSRTYRFENWFRTGQKKHKAFRPAIPLPISWS
jgi:CRISPR-associated protein Csb3